MKCIYCNKEDEYVMIFASSDNEGVIGVHVNPCKWVAQKMKEGESK